MLLRLHISMGNLSAAGQTMQQIEQRAEGVEGEEEERRVATILWDGANGRWGDVVEKLAGSETGVVCFLYSFLFSSLLNER